MSERSVATAYSSTGGSWQAGPGRIYDRLADDLIAHCPGGVRDRLVLDLGAGTGAASRAAHALGAARVVAVDVAIGMLAHDAGRRPPAVVGDATSLPFGDDRFGAVVASFSLNHLTDPVAGLREAVRVLAPGGGLAVSSYAADDSHRVKAVVEDACAARGWVAPPWYTQVKAEAVPQMSTTGRVADVAIAAGLDDATVEQVRSPFPDLAPADLVAWRLGMAQVADFLSGIGATGRAAIEADALDRLGTNPPTLVRSYLVLAWRKPAPDDT